VDADDVGRRPRRTVPDAADDLGDRDRLAGAGGEELEDRELRRREADLAAFDDDEPPLEVDDEAWELQRARRRVVPGPPELRRTRARSSWTENGFVT